MKELLQQKLGFESDYATSRRNEKQVLISSDYHYSNSIPLCELKVSPRVFYFLAILRIGIKTEVI
jgi:hypothetical protein